MLESHLEGEIRYHLHLNSCKLNNAKDEVRNLQLEVGERAQAVQNQFEERVQALQNHFEDRLHALQNRFEERVQALENRFEERVNLITVDTSNKLRKNLSFTIIICAAAAVVILAALSGMSNQESVVNDLKTKMDRSFERQSKLEMKMNEVEKGLKGEFIDLRGQLGKKLDEADKYFEVVSLYMSNHESAVSDFKTKMDRSVERQSKLELKMSEVEEGLRGDLIDLLGQLGKKVGEADKYFEAVSLYMSNHESAVSDFKTKMESRVTDVQTKVEGKLDEAHKHLKEKVS